MVESSGASAGCTQHFGLGRRRTGRGRRAVGAMGRAWRGGRDSAKAVAEAMATGPVR